jgi:hypothetical protein
MSSPYPVLAGSSIRTSQSLKYRQGNTSVSSRPLPASGKLSAFVDSDGKLAWVASHDGRREFFPACSREKAIRTAEQLLGVPVSLENVEGRELLERADALIEKQRRRLGRNSTTGTDDVLCGNYGPICVLPFPEQPAAASETCRVRFPGKEIQVRRSDLRWWLDAPGQEIDFAVTRSDRERKASDVPYLRKQANGKWCVGVEILGEAS